MSKIPTLAVSITDVPRMLMAFYGSGRMAYIRGQPGIGKTDQVKQAALDIEAWLTGNNVAQPKMAVYELHLASMSEVDVRGYLVPSADGEAKFTKPVFASFVEANPRGILFLDEFPQATHEVQKAVAPLILDGKIGDYQLPPSWMVVAAGNREEDNSGTTNMLAHIVNRLSIIDVKPSDPDDWIEWGAKHGIVAELLTFAKVDPAAIFGAPNLEANDSPYCTPRSIHALNDVAQRWAGGIQGMITDSVGLAVAAGFIGPGAMASLKTVLTMTSKLPSYESVVADPMGIKIPTAPNEVYASLMMIAMRAKKEDGAAVVDYVTRFQPNLALVGFVALISRDNAFMHQVKVGEWIRANKTMVQKLTKYIKAR